MDASGSSLQHFGCSLSLPGYLRVVLVTSLQLRCPGHSATPVSGFSGWCTAGRDLSTFIVIVSSFFCGVFYRRWRCFCQCGPLIWGLPLGRRRLCCCLLIFRVIPCCVIFRSFWRMGCSIERFHGLFRRVPLAGDVRRK